MAKVRRINVSQIEGNSANETDTDEIRPYGTMALYQGNYDNTSQQDLLELAIHDGKRTNLKSKVLAPGRLYGSGADSGDETYGFDTIKLIPDATLHDQGSDQYLIVDPTQPNHIHIRAGGTQDASSADLFLGGEQTHVRVSDGNDDVVIRTTDVSGESPLANEWVFSSDGTTYLPHNTVSPLSYLNSPINDESIKLSVGGGDGVQIVADEFSGSTKIWSFNKDGSLELTNTGIITDSITDDDAGTIITVSLNAAGDTEDYVGGASLLEIPKDSDTNQVQAGWIITFSNDVQRTVTEVVDGGSYWAVVYAEANPGLGSNTYPLTIQSADYAVASAGAITLTKDTNSWSFDSNGKLTLPGGVGVDTQGIMNRGDFNIRLTDPFLNEPRVFKFTAEVGPGAIVFPDGTWQYTAAKLDELEIDGTTILTLPDEPVVIQTSYYPTQSAIATGASGEDTFVADISEDDDIIAVQAGWRFNAGDDETPNWITVTQAVVDPGLTCTITVTGVSFTPGITYTFKSNDAVPSEWTFRDIGTLVGPGGAILSNETADLGEGATYRDFTIELLESGGTFEHRLIFRNDGSLEVPGELNVSGSVVTPLGSVIGTGTDVNYIALEAVANAGVMLRATDEEYNFKDWKFNLDGKLVLPGESYANTPSSIYNSDYAIRLYPTYNGYTGLGPELVVRYNDALEITANTNDFSSSGGTKVTSLKLLGAPASGSMESGRVWIDSGYHSSGGPKGAVNIGTQEATEINIGNTGAKVIVKSAVPNTSLGTTGDKVGAVAFGSGYMYYCTANYSATPVTVNWNTVNEVGNGTGDHYISAYIVDPTQLNGVLTVTNVLENGENSASETVTSYAQISGNTYKFYLANTTEPWQTFQNSTLQVQPHIWRRVAWSGDTW